MPENRLLLEYIPHTIEITLPPRKKHYTAYDLRQNHRDYDTNFINLCRTVGTRWHDKFLEIEKALEDRCVEIQKSMGLYLENVCPISNISSLCCDCTGYFKERLWYCKSTNRYVKQHVEAMSDEQGATLCALKNITFDTTEPEELLMTVTTQSIKRGKYSR